MNIDTVLEHYIIAALFLSYDENEKSLEKYDQSDIHPDTLKVMRDDVTKFVTRNEKRLNTWTGKTTPEQQAGHDFWLTRNGHGCGFWESEWGRYGNILTKESQKFSECDLYIGDDGKIYQS